MSVELGLDVIEEELGVYIEKIFERATIRCLGVDQTKITGVMRNGWRNRILDLKRQ